MLSRLLLKAMGCALAVLLATQAAAEPPVAINTAPLFNSALPDLSWVPPLDTFDWVQLKSGEWLKGSAKAMQDDELEFDSEEMDNHVFDWEDIRQLRTGQGRIILIKLLNGDLFIGGITVTPTEVIITGSEPWAAPRDQLQSFTRSGPRERDYWSGKVDFGLTVRSGNTNQTDYNGQAHLQRRTPVTRLKIDYIGNISEAAKVQSANNHRVNAELDIWQSRHFYWVVPAGEYFSDPFQNISQRYTVGAGAGYDIVDKKKVEWTVTVVPSYQSTQFDSFQPGEADSESTAALALTSYFNWEIIDALEWTLEYRGQLAGKESAATTHHAVSTLSVDVTKRLDVDFSLVWDRINNPKVGADGVQPERDDFRFVISLGLDF